MTAGSLTGHCVVVTGAAGLLGQQHCAAVIEQGGHVIAVDIDANRLESLQTVIRSNRLSVAELDITDRNAVEEYFRCRPISSSFSLGLVNNAAVNPKAEGDRNAFNRLESLELDQWDFELSVGLTGALIMTQVIGSEMANRGNGSIINISSDHGVIAPDQGLYGGPDSARVKPVTYSVVKHGLIGLTRYTATYWAHRGVRANALCPGGVHDGQDDSFLREFSRRVPIGRMARPDEYRGAVTFLLSNASSYMTGSVMIIDGGRSTW